MAVNTAFHTSNLHSIASERSLYQDLLKEAIQIYGHDVYYVNRTTVALDNVLGEDSLSKFTTQHPIEMYVEDAEGFGGDKEIISHEINVARSFLPLTFLFNRGTQDYAQRRALQNVERILRKSS